MNCSFDILKNRINDSCFHEFLKKFVNCYDFK